MPKARRVVFACVLGLAAACTDLRVSVRTVAPAEQVQSRMPWRFAAPVLVAAGDANAAAAGRDAALRTAISTALEARGYREAAASEAAGVLVDYTFVEQLLANRKGLDAPSDYVASWPPGLQREDTVSMNHMVADAAFTGELALTLVLLRADTRRALWEGTAQRLAPVGGNAAALARALQPMAKRLVAELAAGPD